MKSEVELDKNLLKNHYPERTGRNYGNNNKIKKRVRGNNQIVKCLMVKQSGNTFLKTIFADGIIVPSITVQEIVKTLFEKPF